MTTKTDTIPSPPSHPTAGPIETLLTAYRRMMPAGCAGSEQLSISLSPTWQSGSARRDRKDTWRVSMQVRVADVVVCDGEGDAAEDAARDALDRLREGGASI